MIDPFVLRWCRAVLQFTMISNVDRLPLRAFHAPLEIAAVKQHRHQREHGLVVIAHGAGEHAARYARLTGELNRAGFAVLSMDHLFRAVSSDHAQFSHYLYGSGVKA